MNISTVFFINEALAVTLGLVTNVLLYYLIERASTSDLRSYTRLLKLHCITDIIYTILNGLCSMRVIYIGKQIFLVILGPFAYWDSFGAPIACCLFTYAFFSELTFVPIDYYYRFVLVCRNDPFTNLRFAFCVILAIVVTAFYTLLSIRSTTYGPSKETFKYWPEIQKRLHLDSNPTSFGIVDPESPRMSLTLSVATIITFSVYAIIAYTTYRIHDTLVENAKRKVRKESSHVRQITLVMIMQALLPFCILALPILIVTAFSVFGISVELIGYLITILISWTPVLKPILTVYIIMPYRRRIKRTFMTNRANTQTTIADTTASNNETPSNQPIKTSEISKFSEEETDNDSICL